jgi:transposase
MKIIGCDFHPSFQQIAMLDLETGELVRRRLMHAPGEAEQFYRGLRGERVKVGIEASGNTRWFERLLGELGHELGMGDAARIRAMVVRRQKTDARDADHLLQLLEREQFPQIWVPSAVERDLRQLVLHRQKLVQMRTRVKNQLQHVALNEGLQKKRQLWTERGRQWLEDLSLPQWTERRRADLLKLLDELSDHRRTEPGSRKASRAGCASAVADDASGSGSDHRSRVCAGGWRCESIRAQQKTVQLSGIDSE